MKTSVTFVPNEEDTRTIEDRIERVAQRTNQNPESILVVPFSELEGELTTVDSNVRVKGQPVPMDVLGNFVNSPVAELEKPNRLGEQLADELDTFEPLDPSEIVNQTTAYIVGDSCPPASVVITSDEDITKLEQHAQGE